MARTLPKPIAPTAEQRRRKLAAMARDKTAPTILFIESFFMSKNLAPKSVKDYRRYLLDYDRFTGCVSLEESMDLDKAAQWVAGLRDRGASVAHNGAQYLKSFASWVAKNRYIMIPGGGSPLRGLESPKVPQSRRQAFTDEQMDKIWDALELTPLRDQFRVKAYVKLLFATGLRKNEARQLAKADLHIDGARSWVHVRALTSKGQKERRVRIDQSVLADIEEYLTNHRTPYIGPRNKPEPLFTTRGGTAFTEWGFSTWTDHIWRAVQRDTGIHGFSHLLRHTWATNFHRASGLTGSTVYDLQRQGGWADLNIPQRYTHERPFDEFLAMPTHVSALRGVRKPSMEASA